MNPTSCVICKAGELRSGFATVTLTRGDITLVVKNAPALVCDNCGEEYVNEAVTKELLHLLDQAARSGVQVDIREYVAA